MNGTVYVITCGLVAPYGTKSWRVTEQLPEDDNHYGTGIYAHAVCETGKEVGSFYWDMRYEGGAQTRKEKYEKFFRDYYGANLLSIDVSEAVQLPLQEVQQAVKQEESEVIAKQQPKKIAARDAAVSFAMKVESRLAYDADDDTYTKKAILDLLNEIIQEEY